MEGKPNGYGTLTLGERTYPFHVGLTQADIYCETAGVTLADYNDTFSPVRLQAGKATGAELRDFLYAALVAGAKVDGVPVDFTPTDIEYLIDDEADQAQPIKPLKELMEQLARRYTRQLERLKNAQAPATGPAPKTKASR